MRQFGFRQCRSSTNFPLTTSGVWKRSLDRHKDICVAVLDTGAFGRVCHRGSIYCKTTKFGDHWWASLTSMEGFFKLSSMISPPKNPLRASIPQGRVLGTLLWNAYHRDILQLTPQAKHIQMTAPWHSLVTETTKQPQSNKSSWDDLGADTGKLHLYHIRPTYHT